MTIKDKFKGIILYLARKCVWDWILEDLAVNCPNYDGCREAAFENYEPDHDEGHD
jgi:hypothetical protein